MLKILINAAAFNRVNTALLTMTITRYQPLDIMYLLAEWEGRTGKYLARNLSISTLSYGRPVFFFQSFVFHFFFPWEGLVSCANGQ